VDQLWACCSSELGRSDSGVANTKTKLLHAMKRLAVRAQNTLINVANFLEMTQSHEEPEFEVFVSVLKPITGS
jgi:hypothetical protein